MTIEWVDAPPPARRGIQPAYGWDALDELRANPGKWAKLHTYKSASGASSASRKLRKDGFECEPRPEGDGSVLYARWPKQTETPAKPRPIRANTSPYPCDHCDQGYDTPAGLKHHVARHHADEAAA